MTEFKMPLRNLKGKKFLRPVEKYTSTISFLVEKTHLKNLFVLAIL